MTDTAPPSRLRLAIELAGLPRLLLGPLGAPPVGRSDVGQGRPVLVFPGFLAGDYLLARLRRALAMNNYRALPWGLGVNRGATPDMRERLGARLDEVRSEVGGPIALVGWSLGGLYARTLAQIRSDDVDLVVTLGSPASGALPEVTNLTRFYNLVSRYRIDDPRIAYDPAKPPARTITFWSRRDGVVAPASARGGPGETDAQVELGCTHVGFVKDAEPLRRLIEVLQP